ncbi:glycosyltransferase [Naasia lichenicola]|uniref:D-inositol 3-phosphate glycosyltransferase n=1 Tax=Naasia lichenicola TaxID=2565933 RepID=A0A4S4FKY4_9MICO|nr:glycosyltransferase [Naasia lichenicola]THG30828.1 glycosyltransferase [Naasia lichenicola]
MSTIEPASPDRATRVDVFLQYYRPHVSGLTNMAAVLAEYAGEHGYDMHVHCVSKDGSPYRRVENGVTVHAYRKSFNLGRGAFSVGLIRSMWRMRKRGGIAHVHMPYPESFVIAALFRRGWKLVGTYQCDAPTEGLGDRLIAAALDLSHRSFIRRSAITVASSADYADSSRLHAVMAQNDREIIPVTAIDRAGGEPRYRIEGKRLIGFMGRPTSEKGINVLISAMERMPHDDVALLFAGPVSGLSEKLGYDTARLQALIDQGRAHSVGFLEEDDIKHYYASLDVFVFPSINSFEAFGIVQVEAMSAGIPVVASDIPGVRTVVQTTGFGEITKAGNDADLLRGLLVALETGYDTQSVRSVLDAKYLPPVPHEAYRRLYDQLA